MIRMPSRRTLVGASMGTAALAAIVVPLTVPVTKTWEGVWLTAKVDTIGTGKPVTWCYGETHAEDPTVRVGQKFTQSQCEAQLSEKIVKYLDGVAKCVTVQLPPEMWAAFTDAAWNAGVGAVCKSPMVRLANAGKLKESCAAFTGWYVRSGGEVRKGLIARRSGVPGDYRVNERELCEQGLR